MEGSRAGEGSRAAVAAADSWAAVAENPGEGSWAAAHSAEDSSAAESSSVAQVRTQPEDLDTLLRRNCETVEREREDNFDRTYVELHP